MLRTNLFSQFFNWKTLVLAGALSFGIMIESAFAQNNNLQKVSVGKASHFTDAFGSNNKTSRKEGANTLRHRTADGKNLELRLNSREVTKGGEEVLLGSVNGSKKQVFMLRTHKGKVSGFVIQNDLKKAYEYATDANGNVTLKEQDINKLVCVPERTLGQNIPNLFFTPIVNSAQAYTYQSLPGSGYTIYLDFDGQNYASSIWAGGGPVKFLSSGLTDEQIRQVYTKIAEDYSPFNVNVTTDSTVYNNTPAGRRIRTLFTFTDYGDGGIANISSFNWNFDSPALVYTNNLGNDADASAEAGSHEIGHTLGLSHDGDAEHAYHSGVDNWGPIMGTAYGKAYSQFSKGEYPGAYNQEDDLAIITTTNGFGYKADDNGNTSAVATVLAFTNSHFQKAGIIEKTTDIDAFKFTIPGTSPVSLNFAVGVKQEESNLKLKVDIYNASNSLVFSYTTQNAQGLSTVLPNLAAGTYYVYIDGVGQGDVATGFSDYASLGAYTLSATIVGTSSGCTAAAWNSTQAYSAGAVVSYAGNKYTAKWWTLGEQPDLNTGSGKPWEPNGPCSSNVAPTVSISSPVNNQVLNSSEILIKANATDSDGSIAYVEFYNGTILLGSSNVSPYQFLWQNVPTGSQTITAKAYDNNGGSTVSAVITLINNIKPSITINSPTALSKVLQGSNLNIAVNATDTDGTIAKVEYFWDKGVKFGQSTAAPFGITATVPAVTNTDEYVLSLTAIATDNKGGQNRSTIDLKVKPTVANVAPIAGIDNGTVTTTGYPFQIIARAVDTDGSISKLEVYFDGVKLGESASEKYTVEAPALAVTGGNHLLTIIATDDEGTQTTLNKDIVATLPPTISISSPAPNAVFADGSKITIVANPVDPDGYITRTDFYQNGVLIGTVNSAPWVFTTPPIHLADTDNGKTSVVAITFDNAGFSRGIGVPVTISATAPNNPPVVVITSPVSTSKYVIGGSVTVAANVTDAESDAITKVEIYSPQLGTGSTVTLTSAPYTTTYSQLPVANPQIGGLTFVVKAYDAKGAIGSSDVFIAQDRKPTVSITSPSNGSVVNAGSVTITADAYDAEGLVRVDFLNKYGAVVATDNTAPYEYTTTVTSGNYNFKAIAYDNVGQSSPTAIVDFTVNQAPVVTMTSPSNGALVQENYSLTLTASASDADGTIAKVEFYSNKSDVKLGEATTAPYSFTIAAAEKGNTFFFAKAIDNSGTVTVSTPVAVTINAAPTATFVSPIANSKYAQTGAMTITLNPVDSDGSIAKVEYFLGNLSTKVGEKTVAPYSLNISSVPLPTAGQNILPVIVKITDNDNGITVTDTYIQSVVNTIPTATITSPANGSSSSTTSVTINVTATDAEVNTAVTKVEYLNNAGTVVFTDTQAPFQYALTGLAAGTYTYKARSYDALNAVSALATVTFTVTGATCTAPAWNVATAYNTGNEVVYAGIRYKANWWTQGNQPDINSGASGSGKPWLSLGTCNSRIGNEELLSSVEVAPVPVQENTLVRLQLHNQEEVNIVVIDASGIQVAELANGSFEPGIHEFILNGSDLASGFYLIKTVTRTNTSLIKVIR